MKPLNKINSKRKCDTMIPGSSKKSSTDLISNASTMSSSEFFTPNRFDTMIIDEESNEPVFNNENKKQRPVSFKSKIPPIIIKKQKCEAIKQLLITNGIKNYNMKVNINGILLHIPNIEEYKKTYDNLKINNIEFFSYELEENKSVKFVLTGLHSMTDEDLKQALAEHNIVPNKVTKLQLNTKRYDDQEVYILHFKKGEMTLNTLRKVKYMSHMVVKWTYYTRKITLTQCRRCQNFGHGTKQCNLNPRCIRCGDAHVSKECPHPPKCLNCKQGEHHYSACNSPLKCCICQGAHLTIRCDKYTSNKTQISIDRHIKCANCSGNHTANYRFCPIREKFIGSRNTVKQTTTGRNKSNDYSQSPSMSTFNYPPLSSPKNPNINNAYSKFSSNSANTIPQQQFRPKYSQVLKSTASEDLFTAPEIIKITNELIILLSRCKSKLDQISTISGILCKYIFNNE